jgi:hypothetical protein
MNSPCFEPWAKAAPMLVALFLANYGYIQIFILHAREDFCFDLSVTIFHRHLLSGERD